MTNEKYNVQQQVGKTALSIFNNKFSNSLSLKYLNRNRICPN